MEKEKFSFFTGTQGVFYYKPNYSFKNPNLSWKPKIKIDWSYKNGSIIGNYSPLDAGKSIVVYIEESPQEKEVAITVQEEVIEKEKTEISYIVDTPTKKEEEGIFFKIKEKILPKNQELESLNRLSEIVRKADGLKPEFYYGEKSNCLCIEDVGFARSLGIIHLLKNFEYQNDVRFSKDFSLISGLGNGAIVSLALALNFDLDRIEYFWRNAWKEVYETSVLGSALNVAKSSLKGKSEHGRSRKKALTALTSFFSKDGKGKELYTFEDLKCEVYIPVMNANNQVHVYTKATSKDASIAIAICDSLDPLDFDSEELIKSNPFHVSFDKSTDITLALSNPKMNILCFGAPQRVFDHGEFKNPTKSELAEINSDTRRHYLEVIRELFFSSHYKGEYQRIYCKPIDEHKRNSTREQALIDAINSAKGVING